MRKDSQEKILNMLSDDDIVLDVGGWACPFNRANYMLDLMPYETRGDYGNFGLVSSQGGDKELFSKETWVEFDICSGERWPFEDNQFDFVTCSHVLEDIRDPLWVCSELLRVSKAGYIEFPSRKWESTRGWEHDRIAGLSHHRWLCEVEDNHIKFTPKYHMIHSSVELSFPWWFNNSMSEAEKNTCLHWKGPFSWEEVHINDLPDIKNELKTFIQKHYKTNRFHILFERFTLFGFKIYKAVLRRTIFRKIFFPKD